MNVSDCVGYCVGYVRSLFVGSMIGFSVLGYGAPADAVSREVEGLVKGEVVMREGDAEVSSRVVVGVDVGDVDSYVGFRGGLSDMVVGGGSSLAFDAVSVDGAVLWGLGEDYRGEKKVRVGLGRGGFAVGGVGFFAGDEDSFGNVYARFMREGSGVGVSYHDVVGGDDGLGVVGVVTLDDVVFSGGTSGVGFDDYFVGGRVGSTDERDFGVEGVVGFDEEGVEWYLVRGGFGNASMGRRGHFDWYGGTGPRVAGIDGASWGLNETDMGAYPLPLELHRRGVYGFEMSGEVGDRPRVEATFNPEKERYWIGGGYDDGFFLSGGVDLFGTVFDVELRLDESGYVRGEWGF